MTLDEAHRVADAIIADMEGVTDRHIAGNRVRRWAKRLCEALDVIEDASRELSAGCCEHRGGDERGHPICLRDGAAL